MKNDKWKLELISMISRHAGLLIYLSVKCHVDLDLTGSHLYSNRYLDELLMFLF